MQMKVCLGNYFSLSQVLLSLFCLQTSFLSPTSFFPSFFFFFFFDPNLQVSVVSSCFCLSIEVLNNRRANFLVPSNLDLYDGNELKCLIAKVVLFFLFVSMFYRTTVTREQVQFRELGLLSLMLLLSSWL